MTTKEGKVNGEVLRGVDVLTLEEAVRVARRCAAELRAQADRAEEMARKIEAGEELTEKDHFIDLDLIGGHGDPPFVQFVAGEAEEENNE